MEHRLQVKKVVGSASLHPPYGWSVIARPGGPKQSPRSADPRGDLSPFALSLSKGAPPALLAMARGARVSDKGAACCALAQAPADARAYPVEASHRVLQERCLTVDL